MSNFVTIGRIGPNGKGYSVIAWTISDKTAENLAAYLTEEMGPHDVESVSDDEGVDAVGAAMTRHTAVVYRDEP